MMKLINAILLILLAIFACALLIVAFAPAAWLGGIVREFSQGFLQIDQAEGFWWRGSAQLQLTSNRSAYTMRLPKRMTWQLQNLSFNSIVFLLSNQEISEPPDNTPVQLKYSRALGVQQLSLSSFDAALPIALLKSIGAPFNTLNLQGNLTVQSNGIVLEWRPSLLTMSGSINIHAQQISSAVSAISPLGDYTFSLTGNRESIDLLLSTTNQGPLLLEGKGKILNGKVRFLGYAQAAKNYEDRLNNLVNILGIHEGYRARLQFYYALLVD